jgi:hypothetical protein
VTRAGLEQLDAETLAWQALKVARRITLSPGGGALLQWRLGSSQR